ncbi:unnamed protein product [Rhizophagus irregularis]|nr:unnamed protein product [Rhizophagus irregularis]
MRLSNPQEKVDTDTVCIKEGKKRIIGEQGDRSKVEDAENEGGEWMTYRGKGIGRGARSRGRHDEFSSYPSRD